MGMLKLTADPMALAAELWPDVKFYRKEEDIIYSVWNNKETVVPAGHMLGKDFTAGFICLAFFLTRSPCRIITTSVDATQLQGVLWGEIGRFIQTCKYPLDFSRGGPLIINHMHIRKVDPKGNVEPLSYLLGRVAARGEGMSGHHIAQTGDGIPRTLFISDEASGVDDVTCEKATEWCDRMLIIGNPYDCENRFKWSVKGRAGTEDRGGDIPRPDGKGYLRKVIKITALDSPNVQFGLKQKELGITPTNEIIVPGVLPYETYILRRMTWDKIKQCVGLDAEFYEGSENLLFPPEWLNRAEEIARKLSKNRRAISIGIDPAEGGDDTAWAAVDELGVIEIVTKKTTDTNVIIGETIAFGKKHGVPPENWCFDRGGGKAHSDRLRAMGYGTRTVAFGETVTEELHRGMKTFDEKKDHLEERYVYKSRRAEMYHNLRLDLDPALNPRGFGLPAEYSELRRQLAPLPLWYDGEGRIFLPPKDLPGGTKDDKNKVTIKRLIGRSPDDADAVMIARYAMKNKAKRTRAGAI